MDSLVVASSDWSEPSARTCPVCGSSKVGSRYCTECATELVPPVMVMHAVGPMWAVNGHLLSVPAGEDLRRTVLGAAARMATIAGPVASSIRVVVTDGSRVTRIVLRPDGSSVTQGDDAAAWAGPGTPASTAETTADRASLVGVHAGAGATTWARLLELSEAELNVKHAGRVVLVCRSTPVGIDAAKAAVHALGAAAVEAVLVVADAPGKPVPAAAREQRVLAGAVPVVPVPWMPRLRAMAEISPQLAGQLARPVQRVSKALLGAQSNKEKAE